MGPNPMGENDGDDGGAAMDEGDDDDGEGHNGYSPPHPEPQVDG